MAYLSLARKYRPSTFTELMGQDAVTSALMNAIRIGREPHAVVFSGIRGVGKTSLARLYAKALNCKAGPSSNPCGVCDSCIAISIGNHEDVMEIDGASNTGVDDVRSLRDTVQYSPQRSKFKVYIIDEVHMLSQSAFNALLKTLEEPPAHVVFIFATTEHGKIPQTIISRCQVFHLEKLPLLQIFDRLKLVVEAEKIPFEVEALNALAREGRGSMRDALTLLDQAVAIGNGSVTTDVLKKFLNFISSNQLVSILTLILNKNAAEILTEIDRLDRSGVDFSELCEQLCIMSRHASVLKVLGLKSKELEYLAFAPEELQSLSKLSDSFEMLEFSRLFRVLVASNKILDGSNIDRFVFENTCLEWCFDPGIPNVEELKNMMRTGIVRELTPQNAPKPNTVRPSSSPSPTTNLAAVENKQRALPATWRLLIDEWRAIKPMLARILEETTVESYSPQKISLLVPMQSLAGAKLFQKDQQESLKEQLKTLFGFEGVLAIQSTERVASEKNISSPPADTLLDQRRSETENKKQQAIDDLKNSSITLEMLHVFGGKIERAEYLDRPSSS